MPTLQLDTPLMREKIALAKKYGDKVKTISLAYNAEMERIWKRHLSLLEKAISDREYVSAIQDSLIDSIKELLSRAISGVVALAIEREEVEDEGYASRIPLIVEQCDVNYYIPTLDKYKSILSEEIDYLVDKGYTSDMALFLENPMGYSSDKKNGLLDLKSSITEVDKGVSYSFSENMKKLGISVAALAYANAQFFIWNQNGNIAGYFGVRNSNFPCPLCDNYAHRFIPLSQGIIYPLHNRCVCSIVPVYQNELS